ncbi:MAG: class I SAM-dependent methyltransferase [Nitrospinae bacterium]|nr:class I SAM-dependent methyltransferase [Nitrospinota bacterium]
MLISDERAMQWALGREGTHEVVSGTDRRGRPLRTVICMDTGLVRNDPVPDDAELARFYAEDYRIAYKGAAKPRRRQILRNFRRVVSHVRTFRDVYGVATRVLDVGAGSGEFAFVMTRLGKTVQAVEPNIPYAAFCREELKLDVSTAHLTPDLFAPCEFDLIRLNHVLEHLNNPVKYLALIACWLKPSGVLYVETPNIESECCERSRGNIFHYAHIFNFNPWTLRACAGLAGLAEASETAQRSAGTTSVFFRRDASDAPPATAESPENARHVHAMIQAHYAGAFRKGKLAKPFIKSAMLLEETLTGMLAGPPRAIGERVARSLRAAMRSG